MVLRLSDSMSAFAVEHFGGMTLGPFWLSLSTYYTVSVSGLTTQARLELIPVLFRSLLLGSLTFLVLLYYGECCRISSEAENDGARGPDG